MSASVNPLPPRPVHVLHAACALYAISVEVLLSHKRWPEIVRARRAVVWLCHERLGASWSGLGRLLELHHTTVMDAHERARTEVATNDLFCEELAAIWKLAQDVPPVVVDTRSVDTRVLH
jgi:chromosomal replication initiation ATPase DnaA